MGPMCQYMVLYFNAQSLYDMYMGAWELRPRALVKRYSCPDVCRAREIGLSPHAKKIVLTSLH